MWDPRNKDEVATAQAAFDAAKAKGMLTSPFTPSPVSPPGTVIKEVPQEGNGKVLIMIRQTRGG